MTGIDVVIPLFNKADYVAQTIASLAAQSTPPDALYIVDDASSDGSLAMAQQAIAQHAAAFRNTQVELIQHSSNQGPGAARNRGMTACEHDLLLFLDADDLLRPDALDRMRGAMDDHRLGMAVIGYTSIPHGEQFPTPNVMDLRLQQIGADLYLLPQPLSTVSHPEFLMGRASNVVVRREWIGAEKFGTARLNEGVDFWYRVLKNLVGKEGRMGLIASPLIQYRILDDSLSHRAFHSWHELTIPPLVQRYADSRDAMEREMAAMLVARWREHAQAALPHDQWPLFEAHHRALFDRMAA